MSEISIPAQQSTLQPLGDDEISAISADLEALKRTIGTRVVGKDVAIDHVLTALIGGGHILIEDVPGVGKTTLAVSLALAMGGSHNRIQFTSDLLPSDVLGVPVFDQERRSFDFKRGPIFANVVLADEINRSTPKTQSAMLEAMQDGKVSVDLDVHELPHPFMVVATQNPVEHHGTYPLPESQLDRFMMRIHVGYPDPAFEARVLREPELHRTRVALDPVTSPERIAEIQDSVSRVTVTDELIGYMLAIVGATRDHDDIELGVSTRGSLMLLRAAQALALLGGRGFVSPDDVKSVVRPVLGHRIVVRSGAQGFMMHSDYENESSRVLDRILSEIEAPL
ncbi:MAG: MoxR-like ATPase [Candidatus Promineifilaceae bacterium]|jgi:MoxR-like ATPase